MKVKRGSQIQWMVPVLVALCLTALPAQAKYSGGTGEPNDPYQIATAADLIALGETAADYNRHLLLTANIDLDPNLPGRRVFDKAVIARLTGVFDGDGHTISHLTIDGGGYLGLFGELRKGAEVKNLAVVDVNVMGSSDYVGGLVGSNGGALTGCNSTGVVRGREDVGGLVGDNWGPVAQCHSACAVGGGNGVGGLIGENSDGTVNNCYSTGPVRGTGWDGGLTAYNAGAVVHCFWDTQTSGQATSAGGAGKTTAEMQTAATFLEAGWDFVGETTNGSDDIWKISEGLDYPRLWWAKYSGGSGTAQHPYQIATAADLIALGEDPGNYDKHFVLTADIDLDPNLPGRKVFDKAVIAPDMDSTSGSPEYNGTAFTGVLDGRGFAIKNLTMAGGGYLGLFGQIGDRSQIVNLRIEDANVIGRGDSIGIVAGRSAGVIIKCSSSGTLKGAFAYGVGGLVGFSQGGDVMNSQSNVSVNYNSAYQVGGLVGVNEHGRVSNSYSNASILCNEGVRIGMLVGYNTGDICNCHSAGTAGGNPREYIGGLIGHNCGLVRNSWSTGTVSGFEDVGGLVGYNDHGSITICASTSTVSGYKYVGGLIGCNFGSVVNSYSSGTVRGTDEEVGGLVGSNYDSVESCYCTGSVDAGYWDVGGLVGYNDFHAVISNSYSTGMVTGNHVVGGFVGYNNGAIEKCYSIGAGKGDYARNMGLVGGTFPGYGSASVTSSLWDTQTSGTTTSAGGTGKTTAEMQTAKTFLNAGWDFVGEGQNGVENTWTICERTDYPQLTWQFVVGDFDTDEDTDLRDFCIFASSWLGTAGSFWCQAPHLPTRVGIPGGIVGTDLTNDGLVDYEDLMLFAEGWLSCVAP
jgi:hypothetical protein